MGLDSTSFPGQSMDQMVVPLATSTTDLVTKINDLFEKNHASHFSMLSWESQDLVMQMIARYEHFYTLTEDDYASIRSLIFRYSIEKEYFGYSDELKGIIRGRSYKQ